MGQQKIIWFAIAFSTVIYLVMLLAVAGTPLRPFEDSVRQQITQVLYVVAVVMFFVASTLPARGTPQNTMIVTLALFESCAILGLVAAFVAHDWRIYLAPWALALIGFVRNFPSE